MNGIKLFLLMVAFVCTVGCSDGSSGGGGTTDSDIDTDTDTDADTDTDTDTASGIDILLEASVIEGAAPLAIFFDASETIAEEHTSRPFHELIFRWSFDDPGSGDWETSQKSKNEAFGPVAAHVFDSPGTYSVTLNVYGSGGAEATEQVEINVQDPDTVFSGTDTICLSLAGDFTGCPSGASQVAASSFSDITGHVSSGRRILLRRGESWTSSQAVTLNVPGPGIIGAFGSGDAPIITSTTQIFNLSGGTPQLDDWRIMDLELTGSLDGPPIMAQGRIQHILFFRLNIHDTYQGIQVADSITDYYDQQLHDQLAIVECRIVDTQIHNAYVSSARMMLLGNQLTDSANSHVLRTPSVDKGVLSHNDLADAASGRHVLKMHAPCRSATDLSYPCPHEDGWSEKIVLSDNGFRGLLSDWTVTVGPMSGEHEEWIRDVIIENNRFMGDDSTQVLLKIWAQDITIRNNVFNTTGSLFHTAIDISRRGLEPPPTNVAVRHNTGYSADSSPFTFVAIADECSDTTVRNNLVCAPASSGATPIQGAGAGLIDENNPVIANAGFVVSSPEDGVDFQLTEGSPAVDSALDGAVLFDFLSTTRPQGASSDIGAFEMPADE